jgi:hypothetical protein
LLIGYGNGMELNADARRLLRVYLNDHRAGAAAGLALARRCLHNNEHWRLGETLRGLIADIETDAGTLDRIIARMGIAENRPKQLLATAAERIGRLKLNARVTRYSPLSRLLELEALIAGIDAKRSLWCALGSSSAADALSSEFDFAELAERATEQRRRLHGHHREAAELAFGSASERGGLDVHETIGRPGPTC